MDQHLQSKQQQKGWDASPLLSPHLCGHKQGKEINKTCFYLFPRRHTYDMATQQIRKRYLKNKKEREHCNKKSSYLYTKEFAVLFFIL
jgi:hypothetical protein